MPSQPASKRLLVESQLGAQIATLTGGKVPDAQLPARLDATTLTDSIVTQSAAKIGEVLNDGQPIIFEPLPVAASGLMAYNAAAIAQDTITTAPNGDQYAVYWDANREPRIAAKPSTLTTWTSVSLASVAGNPLAAPVVLDSHNNIVVAVDGDGYIHVSGNHHTHPLRYIRSANPYDISAWIRPGMVGTEEQNVTYPQFVRVADGDLLFFYRDGGSGNGDHLINRYDTATKTWSRVTRFLKGAAPVAPDQCAYINRIARSADGTLHVFYMWRESGDETTNTDLSYIKSVDDGVTWRTVSGEVQALPITPSNTAPRILAGNPGGLINQSGASVDSNGIPHTAFWLTGGPSKQLHHFYWNGAAWANVIVADSTSGISRPTMYSTSDGKTYAIFARWNKPVAKRVYPTQGAEIQLFPHYQGGWEPAYDAHAPANKLRMMVAPSSTTNKLYASTYAGIVTVDMSQVDALPASLVYPRPRSVTAPEDNRPVAGLPLFPSKWYVAAGTVTSTDTALADGDFRGAIVTAAETAYINNMAIEVVGRANLGGATRIVIFSLKGELLYTSAAISTATVGVKTVNTDFYLTKGQTVVVGTLTQGATSAAMKWLETYRDNRIGSATATSALTGSQFSGVAVTIGAGAIPATVAFNGTSRVPAVALGVWSG